MHNSRLALCASRSSYLLSNPLPASTSSVIFARASSSPRRTAYLHHVAALCNLALTTSQPRSREGLSRDLNFSHPSVSIYFLGKDSLPQLILLLLGFKLVPPCGSGSTALAAYHVGEHIIISHRNPNRCLWRKW